MKSQQKSELESYELKLYRAEDSTIRYHQKSERVMNRWYADFTKIITNYSAKQKSTITTLQKAKETQLIVEIDWGRTSDSVVVERREIDLTNSEK